MKKITNALRLNVLSRRLHQAYCYKGENGKARYCVELGTPPRAGDDTTFIGALDKAILSEQESDID